LSDLRLNELTLQAEERTHLAHDLQDEIGPFSFSVNLNAGVIKQAATSGRLEKWPWRDDDRWPVY
jgi:hypothetical protein